MACTRQNASVTGISTASASSLADCTGSDGGVVGDPGPGVCRFLRCLGGGGDAEDDVGCFRCCSLGVEDVRHFLWRF